MLTVKMPSRKLASFLKLASSLKHRRCCAFACSKSFCLLSLAYVISESERRKEYVHVFLVSSEFEFFHVSRPFVFFEQIVCLYPLTIFLQSCVYFPCFSKVHIKIIT